MIRDTEVIVEDSTWPGKSAPPEIAHLAGFRSVDVRHALAFTAICTRPPEIHGFHLSDFWAFLRYGFAFGVTRDLRLRSEWGAIDPHQKTVLSDELGVGFTTELLASAFGCRDFADTIYVVNVVAPGKFSLLSSAKRGPKKSPDYIAWDAAGNYYAFECKGTQASRTALRRAVQAGRAQKRTLKTRKGTVIKHSLVAGLFIPQAQNPEASCIRIADPSWNQLDRTLAEVPREQVGDAVVQISLAKTLALAGFVAAPRVLSRAPVASERRLSDEARAELTRRRLGPDPALELLFDTADLMARVGFDTPPFGRARFSAHVPDELLARLSEAGTLNAPIREFGELSRAGAWEQVVGENQAEVRTPLGIRFRVEID